MTNDELLKNLISVIDFVMHCKDYRFHNNDGTWYSRESCKDLTNDEVFEELKGELYSLIKDETVDMRDIFKQSCNVYPKIMIKDLQSGRQFEFGKNTHDRLIISEDGRTLSYYDLQSGDGSRYGDYRFEYEKPSVEEYDENIAYADFYARMVSNENILNGGEK